MLHNTQNNISVFIEAPAAVIQDCRFRGCLLCVYGLCFCMHRFISAVCWYQIYLKEIQVTIYNRFPFPRCNSQFKKLTVGSWARTRLTKQSLLKDRDAPIWLFQSQNRCLGSVSVDTQYRSDNVVELMISCIQVLEKILAWWKRVPWL